MCVCVRKRERERERDRENEYYHKFVFGVSEWNDMTKLKIGHFKLSKTNLIINY